MTKPKIGTGLGRLPATDDRDRAHHMLLAVPTPPTRTRRYWNSAPALNQGATSQCVAYAWVGYLADGPIVQKVAKMPAPGVVYREARKVDEWEGEDYDGTSVRAGAKVMQGLGAIGEYLWAWDTESVVRALLEVGPVVVGTNWYESMFTPGPGARLVVDPDSGVAGGHAYLLNGVNTDDGLVRVKNSWGTGWGDRGRAWMTLVDLTHLLVEGGEAVLATEHRL